MPPTHVSSAFHFQKDWSLLIHCSRTHSSISTNTHSILHDTFHATTGGTTCGLLQFRCSEFLPSKTSWSNLGTTFSCRNFASFTLKNINEDWVIVLQNSAVQSVRGTRKLLVASLLNSSTHSLYDLSNLSLDLLKDHWSEVIFPPDYLRLWLTHFYATTQSHNG